MPSSRRSSQQTCSDPHLWPPREVNQAYMQFHAKRSRALLGRMGLLHGLNNPRNPRVPAKKKHKGGNPMAWCHPDNQYMSQSCRDLIYALKEHKPGLPFPKFDAVGVVYAIFFMVAGSPGVAGHYVGITHRTVTERFEEHVRQAKDYRIGLRILDGEAEKLYGKMASMGISNCYFVPLQQVEGVLPNHSSDFYAAAKRYEREWIRILDSRDSGFNSYIPGGQATLFSSFLDSFQGCVHSLWHPIRYLYRSRTIRVGGFAYEYRDYVRRFQAFHARRHLTGNQGQEAVIRKMRRQNLERMVAVASLHSIQGISPEDQGVVVDFIIQHLTSRVQNRHRRGKKANKMFLPPFMSVLLDDLPLQRILASDELSSLLPSEMRHVHIMLGYSYSCPIGRRWYNYRGFFTSHTTQELRQLADSPCDCHLAEYDEFKLPGCDHVTTCSPEFLRRKFPHLPNLAAIWERGAKYRPHEYPLDAIEHRIEVALCLEGTMGLFKQRMAKKFNVQEHMLTPWCTEAMAKIHVAMQQLPSPTLTPLGPQDAPTYGHAEKAAMASLLEKYICCSVDKLSNNMFLACKHVMAQAQVDEIESAINEQDPTYISVPSSLQDISLAADTIFAQSQIDRAEASLPFLYPIPKVHKPQLAFRFITACTKFLF